MAARDNVKTYQKRIAELDAAHRRAENRLVDQQRKRAELIVAQDELVAEARQAVEEATATMAAEIGPELAARLTGCELTEVRRLVRQLTKATNGERGDQPARSRDGAAAADSTSRLARP